MDINQDLRSIRNEICNWIYISTAICGVPAVIASLLRSAAIGWHWVMLQQIVVLSLILLFYVFRQHTPYSLRAGYLVLVFGLTGMLGLLKYGLMSAGIPMLIVAPTLAVILFGLRAGVYCVVLTLAVAGMIGIKTIDGTLVNNFTVATYIKLTPSWILFLMVSLLCMVVPITAIIKIERHLTSALLLSGKNRDELEQLVITRTQELEKAKQEAESLARTDPLTGINNRRAFYELSNMLDNQARRSQRAYTALMIDLDYFKSINDSYGHESGDSVLKLVSDIILRVFRSSDIVGRIGGEEFAVMLPDTNLENALTLAEKLRANIENTVIQAPKGEIEITASVGVAALDSSAASFEQVISNADEALYQAKRRGRNRVHCYTSNMAIIK